MVHHCSWKDSWKRNLTKDLSDTFGLAVQISASVCFHSKPTQQQCQKSLGSEFSNGSSCAEKNSTSSGSRGDPFMYCIWQKYSAISPSWRVCLVCDWKCSAFPICLLDILSSFSPSAIPQRSNNLKSHPEFQLLFFSPQLNSLGLHPVWHMAKRCFSFLAGHGHLGVTENDEAKGSTPRIPDDWCLINLITYPLSTATKRGAIIATSFCDVSSTCGLRGRINSYLSVAGFWWFPQHLFLQNSDLNKQKQTKNVCI